MDLGIHNKRALVLGSSEGIGFAIAEALAREGVHVAILGRNIEKLNAAKKRIQDSANVNVSIISTDLQKHHSLDQIAEGIAELGGIDILINNTPGPPMELFANTSSAIWQKYFELMVMRLIDVTRLCLTSMLEQQWGRIINIASSSIIQPINGLALSSTLRNIFLAWSKTLANEVAEQYITVNAVLPGKFATQRLASLEAKRAVTLEMSLEEIKTQTLAAIPMKRYGNVEELASVVAFLASQQASYITGTTFQVDGGLVSAI